VAEYRYLLRGELDLALAPQVQADLKQIVASSHAHVLIDCTDLTFIDLMGVTVLLEAHRDLETHGRHLLIVNVQDGPQRIFEMLGLGDLLRYDRTRTLQIA